MTKKKLLWFIPLCIFIMCAGFFCYRYAGLPSIPKEDPVKITAVFAGKEASETYEFTEPDKISGIMEHFQNARFYRKAHRVEYIGYPFVLDSVRFEYAGGETLVYTSQGGPQFYLQNESGRDSSQLYTMKKEDFQKFDASLRKACGYPKASL